LTVEHYASGVPRQIGFALYEDAAHYDALAVDVRWPILAFQGRQDDLVEPAMVERWAAAHPVVTLHLVDDGHQLAASFEAIWEASERFLL
jgi:hypothetical protein